MKRSIFFDYSIKNIIEKYKNKSLSPVDVAKSTIEYIKENESIYHVWTCIDFEKLLSQAKSLEKRILDGGEIRLLEGIPVGVKDIMNTSDFPTQMGSQIWKDFTPGNDARVVFNVKRAGAVIPGKTATAEFAVHTLCDTINPHDKTKTPGTSSTGSAVGVATGMIPVSLGTQTAGSIVRPASFCGIYGVKPSFGLIPRTGILKTSDTLDTVGFFSYHVDDIESIFRSVIVQGCDYPISTEALSDLNRQSLPLNNALKIGIVFTHTWNYAAEYAKREFINWTNKLSMCNGLVVEEVENQDFLKESHFIHDTIYNKNLAYYFREEFEQGDLVSPIMRDLISKGLSITFDEFRQALNAQEELAQQVDEVLNKYDFVISLSVAGSAPMREQIEKPDPALIWTMTYVPVISAPVFTSPEGLPFGLQLVGKRYNDFKLIKFAQYLKSLHLIPATSNALCSQQYKFCKSSENKPSA